MRKSRLWSCTLMLSIILVVCGCDNKEEVIGNAKMSECLSERSVRNALESIRCSMKENSLIFFHQNRMVSCDAETCDVSVKVDGNVLTIYENVKAKGEVNCTCPVNIEYAINELEQKAYTVKVIVAHEVYAQFEIVVNDTCDQTYPIE